MKIQPILFSVLLAATLNASATTPEVIDPIDEFNAQGFYTFRPDLRKCITPLCGGLFVKAVNREQTRCADGSLQQECYVATVVNKTNVNYVEGGLLQGKIKPKKYKGFGNLGKFELSAAFRPAVTTTASSYFVGLHNNGRVCITTPCFSFDEYVLNSKKVKDVSLIDLEQVGASEEDLKTAWAIISEGGNSALLATGTNEYVQELDGIGVHFIADQFYLPIAPEKN